MKLGTFDIFGNIAVVKFSEQISARDKKRFANKIEAVKIAFDTSLL